MSQTSWLCHQHLKTATIIKSVMTVAVWLLETKNTYDSYTYIFRYTWYRLSIVCCSLSPSFWSSIWWFCFWSSSFFFQNSSLTLWRRHSPCGDGDFSDSIVETVWKRPPTNQRSSSSQATNQRSALIVKGSINLEKLEKVSELP